MSRREKHPVHDFLFEYYSFRPAQLLRWTPGAHVLLEAAESADLEWSEFTSWDGGMMLLAGSFTSHRLSYLDWAIEYLEATRTREPSFACLGLHEWAMVYRDPNVRHPYVPLRLGREDINRVVESQPLRCTHYDAYRFFSAEAAPRNRWPLSRQAATDFDQAGCLHVHMDLYRFAYRIAPYCPSEVVGDAFELAAAAREIDMRASPYDLAGYGFEPIPIEIPTGREEYIDQQRRLYERSIPVRERILAVYRGLREGCSSRFPCSAL